MIEHKVKILIEFDEGLLVKNEQLFPMLKEDLEGFVHEMQELGLKCTYEMIEEQTKKF